MADQPAPTQPTAPQGAPQGGGIGGVLGFVAVLVIGVAAGSYLTRGPKPAPVSGPKALADAKAAITKGDRASAAQLFAAAAAEDPDSSAGREARDGLSKLADGCAAASVPLHDAAVVVATAFDSAASVSSATVDALCKRAVAEVAADPKGACELTKSLFEATQGPEVLDARRKTLDAALEKNKDDQDAAIARAELDIEGGEPDKAAIRLEPFAAKLGDGEGARVLGIALTQTHGEDRALALLESYYKAHIDDLGRGLEGLNAADGKAREKAWQALQAGDVTPVFKRKLEEAGSKEARKPLIDGWIRERVLRDKDVRRALRAVLSARKVAEAAVALGGLEVKLAADKPAERRQHLEAAERYVSSVLSVAGHDDQLLFLARVRFDLGRDKDANAILDELFKRHGRTGDLLLALAIAFQRVGPARDSARAFAQEAWEKLPDGKPREKAAGVRSSLATSTQDAVEWLARAGSSSEVRSALAQGRAQIAREEGRFDEARKLIDEALAAVEGKPDVSPDQLAFLHSERFVTTGDRADLDASISIHEKQAAHPDAHPPILDLLADELFTRAIFDGVKDRLKTDLVRERSLELFYFAATDEKDLEALIAAFTASADRKRSVALREQALALDSSREETWEGLLADASARRDVAAVESLADRIAKAPIERAEQTKRLAEYWKGDSDSVYREGLAKKRKLDDAVLELARKQGDATTIARALVARGSLERDAPGIGAPADSDLDVKLCEEAEKIAPRPFTHNALQQALLGRALEHARKTSRALDDLAHDHAKLGAPAVLAIGARSETSLADALAKDEDVKRAATLSSVDGEPQTLGLRAAALARSAGLDAIAKRLAGSRLALARARANFALTPTSPLCVLELATVLEARGEKDEATKVFEKAKKDGVLLPFDLLLR